MPTEVSHLPLRATTLRADARGGIARVVLSQRFVNPHAETLTVTYRMPLPADGAVSGYAFRIGDRRIVGEIDRRAAARQRFEQAIVEGRGAAIVEQERSSLFTQEIHGIPPGGELVAEITVDQRLAWLDEGAWEWRFPLAAAPRYLGAPGAIADAARVALDVAPEVAARFTLDLAVRDAVVRAPESPSHPLARAVVGGAERASLAAGEAPLDRDVVVRWAVAQDTPGITFDLARPLAPRGKQGDTAYGLITLVPPLPARQPSAVPRDLVILLDRSGSMGGEPLRQAKRVCAALLDGLGVDDSVQLAAFAQAMESWRERAARATPEVKRDAAAWVAALVAGGGTEMRSAIVEALAGLRPEAQRQVVVISDGLIGSEEETVADILKSLPEASRLHTVGIGSAVNRSFTAAAARAGRGVEVIIGLGEDPERAARQLLARTRAPLLVDITLTGPALVAPARVPDLCAAGPVLIPARLEARGGDLVVRGRSAEGTWEHRVRVPAVAPGEGNPGVIALFARERVEDAEMRLSAGGDRRAIDGEIEQLGLDFQISTRVTSWVAVDERPSVDPGAPVRTVRVPQQLPHGLSADAFGVREPAPRMPEEIVYTRTRASVPRDDFHELTRVTRVVQPAGVATARRTEDCLVVIYTKEPTLLGKRFVLEHDTTRVGRSADNHIVLDGDAVSRRHAHFEQRGDRVLLVDDGSTNGTTCNDEQISREVVLKNGDRVKVGQTIFKFLSGGDVEAQYHEEIYRMTIMDGLTQVHNKRYLHEALEREIIRSRRHGRDLATLMFDIDHFKRVNDTHGHLAGDFVLKEIARIVQARTRRDEVLARYGGEEFAIILPETSLEGAVTLAQTLREKVREHLFVFQADPIRVTISVGAALLQDGDHTANDLLKRADARLYAAKNGGRDRVCS